MAREMKDSGIEWIGEIPREWDIRKLKYCSEFIQDKYSDKNGELEYIGLENISSWSGKYISTDSQYDRAQSLLFQAEDILWGKLRPYLAKVYHTKKSGCCSSEFCVIRVSKDYSIRYFWNLLISSEFVYAIDRSTYGTKMPRANAEFIRNTFIPVPDKHEQQAIADFLDTQCAHIDSVIEKTRAAIEEYKKLKQAVITQAVTKGIRPNREMKDSGIEWIGEIPKKWICTIMKRFCRFQTGSTPSTNNPQWFDGNLDWFTPSDFNEKCFLSNSIRKLSKKAKEDGVATLIEPNTVMIIGIGGTAGKIGFTTSECSCNQQITAVKPNNELLSKYLMYWMISNTKILKDTALYTTLPIINNQTIGEFLLIMPETISEQSEIVAYLDEKTAAIDSLVQKKQQLITELEAYKKSLIYEYVTGKKEVPVHAH